MPSTGSSAHRFPGRCCHYHQGSPSSRLQRSGQRRHWQRVVHSGARAQPSSGDARQGCCCWNPATRRNESLTVRTGHRSGRGHPVRRGQSPLQAPLDLSAHHSNNSHTNPDTIHTHSRACHTNPTDSAASSPHPLDQMGYYCRYTTHNHSADSHPPQMTNASPSPPDTRIPTPLPSVNGIPSLQPPYSASRCKTAHRSKICSLPAS